MKSCLYITPNLAFTTNKITNPYVLDLADAWEQGGASVIRSPYVKGLRTADLGLYLHKADILMLNWPEDLFHRPLGNTQAWMLKHLIRLFKWKGGKVVWTMHNRVSHRADARHKQKIFTDWIIKQSDLIVVHAEEGLALLPVSSKTLYYPHPFRIPSKVIRKEEEFEYDAIIWGNMSPYKGIDKFLSFLHKNNLHDQYKILICGNCSNKEYADELRSYASSTIAVKIGFVSDEELSYYFSQSRTVLFTHSGESVLTSGTLAESLSHMKTVIAPDRGNFNDFAKKGLVHTYKTFDDIPFLLSKCKLEPEVYLFSPHIIQSTIEKYNWLDYVKTIYNSLYQPADYPVVNL